MAATTIQTKHLGQIRGRTAEGVTQFLGIKYATLQDRLADAQLVEKHDGGIVDATKDGPTAISPSFGCDVEQAAIQHKLPPKELAQSGIDCLNLNIAVPEGTTASSKLPILAEIQKMLQQLEKALVQRAIAMSGSYLFTQALPYGIQEQNYQQVVSALGLENASIKERIQTLLEKPEQELIAKLPPSVLAAPAVDGDLVASAATHALTADRTSGLTKRGNWCTELMIGDCQMDASILGVIMPNLKENCAEKFTTAMNKVLSSQPDVAQRILGEYGIRKGMPDNEAFPAVLNYVNDICFFAPVLTFIRGWRGNSHVYYFNEGNPWEGPWKGKATHILDVAYLTQNFQEFMKPSQQLVATTFAEDFFKFCHGTSPWPAVTNGDITTNFTARVYGPSSEGHFVGQVSEPYKGESHRRSILFDCNDAVSLDELAGVFDVFKTM
ncbi:hypothetical protein APSETT444_008912 [Aspergillus pseudonomiae]